MKSAHQSSQKRLSSKPQVRNKEPKLPLRRQDFDADTGQVYHEVEVTFKAKQNSDWIGELKTPSIAKRSKPAALGSRSLTDTVQRKCVAEVRNFTPQHFDAIPWSLATGIWDLITSNHSESFHAWRTLAAAYNREDEFGNADHRYHLIIKQPPLPVQDYYRGISSPEIKWLSALRISPKQITIPDLVAIANIKNLAVLDLSDGQLLLDTMPPRLDERIVRTWADLAETGRAFQHLEVLLLGWQDNISNWIFRYLNKFPRLRAVITTDCRNMHQKNRADWEPAATQSGWTAYHAKKSAKILRPILDDKKFHVAATSNLYYQTPERMVRGEELGKIDEPEKLPIIECWLGTPRLWTHILDEFPGTRTVWLEQETASTLRQAIATKTETSEADPTKRLREVGSSSLTTPSPPRKKSHAGKDIKLKAPTRTAASLLADMST